MKNIKWLSLVVFIFSIFIFGFYYIREVKTRDVKGPVITMEEYQIMVSIHDGEDVLLKGVTAADEKDGDVTGSIVIESLSEFVEGQKRYINYAAFDSDNHVTKTSRKLIYTDYTPIRFSLDAPLRFPAASSATQDVLGHVYAKDCLDGDISDNVNFSADSSVSMYDAGDYKVTLEVTNSAGDRAELPVTISVYNSLEESSKPKILLSEYLVYTTVGSSLDLRSYLESVTYHGTEYRLTEEAGIFGTDTEALDRESLLAYQEQLETDPTVSYDKIQITNTADYQTPGVYEVQYSLTDADGNTGKVSLVVIVEEE